GDINPCIRSKCDLVTRWRPDHRLYPLIYCQNSVRLTRLGIESRDGEVPETWVAGLQIGVIRYPGQTSVRGPRQEVQFFQNVCLRSGNQLNRPAGSIPNK